MIPRAVARVKRGAWSTDPIDVVTLTFDRRSAPRAGLRTDAGLAIALDLPPGAILRGGDGLRLDDGRIVRVAAAVEPLLEGVGDGVALMRAAWACGACEIPVETAERRLRVRPQASARALLARAGLKIEPVRAPFEPDLAERPAQRLERSIF